MTAQEFETSLRELLLRRPFEPFVVEYVDGGRLKVRTRHVAFSGGAGGYIGKKRIHFFDHTNVKQFVPLKRGSTSGP